MFVSVIIPVRNMATSLPAQLEALATQRTTRQFEVIVADHGSSDGLAFVVEAFVGRFEHLVVVDASTCTGVADVRNTAVRGSVGEVLAFCDADDVVHPDWLQSITAPVLVSYCLAVGSRSGLIAGSVAPPEDAWPTGSTPKVVMGHLTSGDSCNMSMRRSDFDAIHGFDTAFQRSSDIDFAWRIQYAGVPVARVPSAQVMKGYPATRLLRWRKFASWGFQQPHLFRVHKPHGVPPRTSRQAVKELLHIMRHIAGDLLRDRRISDYAVNRSARAAGRLWGSIYWRVWYP